MIVARSSGTSGSTRSMKLATASPIPVEMIGHVHFPRIGELPYLLTFAPHAFYWFQLTDGAEAGG